MSIMRPDGSDPSVILKRHDDQLKDLLGALGKNQVLTRAPMQPIGYSNAQQFIATTFASDTQSDEPQHDVPLDMGDSVSFTIDSDDIYVFTTAWVQAQYTYTGTAFVSGYAYAGWEVRTDPADPSTVVGRFAAQMLFDSRNAGYIQANVEGVWQMPAGTFWVVPIVSGMKGTMTNRVISFTTYLLGHY